MEDNIVYYANSDQIIQKNMDLNVINLYPQYLNKIQEDFYKREANKLLFKIFSKYEV